MRAYGFNGVFYFIKMSGWIKIHRQILEWEWFDDKNAFRLFMYLLLKANHKDRNYKGKIVKVGETLTGLDLLSREIGLTVQQTRTALSKLKSTNEITIKTSTQGTVIQVVNYEKYQTVTDELTNEQQTNNKRITTNKNDKKEKNEKTIEIRKQDFADLLKPFLKTYGNDMLNDFYLYWTEHGVKDRFMRFEKQSVFDVSRRLLTWSKNNFNQRNDESQDEYMKNVMKQVNQINKL